MKSLQTVEQIQKKEIDSANKNVENQQLKIDILKAGKNR